MKTADDGSEAWLWISTELAGQPEGSKVDVRILIAEGKRRGYCICPKPMRQMIDFSGMSCSWCLMPETRQSWQFWYGKRETASADDV